jgi:aspartate 1-decarboxylase
MKSKSARRYQPRIVLVDDHNRLQEVEKTGKGKGG